MAQYLRLYFCLFQTTVQSMRYSENMTYRGKLGEVLPGGTHRRRLAEQFGHANRANLLLDGARNLKPHTDKLIDHQQTRITTLGLFQSGKISFQPSLVSFYHPTFCVSREMRRSTTMVHMLGCTLSTNSISSAPPYRTAHRKNGVRVRRL